jgi:hypothetical protein
MVWIDKKFNHIEQVNRRSFEALPIRIYLYNLGTDSQISIQIPRSDWASSPMALRIWVSKFGVRFCPELGWASKSESDYHKFGLQRRILYSMMLPFTFSREELCRDADGKTRTEVPPNHTVSIQAYLRRPVTIVEPPHRRPKQQSWPYSLWEAPPPPHTGLAWSEIHRTRTWIDLVFCW